LVTLALLKLNVATHKWTTTISWTMFDVDTPTVLSVCRW